MYVRIHYADARLGKTLLLVELPQLLPEVLDEDRMHRIFDELLGLEDPYATFEEVGVVLAEVVLAETSPGDLAAFLDNLDDALSPLLATAAIGPLNSLLRRLSLLCRETDGPPFRVEALTEFFVRLSRSDRLKLLAGAIDQDWQDEWKGGLFTFVSLQSPSSIDQLVIFLGSIKTLAPRRVVADALLLLSGRQASFFRKLLPLPNWHLVADALYALSKIGDPTSLDSIIGAFARDEHSVRLEVLQALQGYQSPRIQDLMLAGLQDSHQSVRMAALRYLALYRVKEAAGPVQAAITNRQFASRKFEEKRGWFITLGHTGGADLLPQMKKRVWAARGTSTVTEDVHLALLAIRSIRIPEAVSFLTDFAESARGELRVLARQLLGDPRKRS